MVGHGGHPMLGHLLLPLNSCCQKELKMHEIQYLSDYLEAAICLVMTATAQFKLKQIYIIRKSGRDA